MQCFIKVDRDWVASEINKNGRETEGVFYFWKCNCGEDLTTRTKVHAHKIQGHTKNPQYRCFPCRVDFDGLGDALRHRTAHKTDEPRELIKKNSKWSRPGAKMEFWKPETDHPIVINVDASFAKEKKTAKSAALARARDGKFISLKLTEHNDLNGNTQAEALAFFDGMEVVGRIMVNQGVLNFEFQTDSVSIYNLLEVRLPEITTGIRKQRNFSETMNLVEKINRRRKQTVGLESIVKFATTEANRAVDVAGRIPGVGFWEQLEDIPPDVDDEFQNALMEDTNNVGRMRWKKEKKKKEKKKNDGHVEEEEESSVSVPHEDQEDAK